MWRKTDDLKSSRYFSTSGQGLNKRTEKVQKKHDLERVKHLLLRTQPLMRNHFSKRSVHRFYLLFIYRFYRFWLLFIYRFYQFYLFFLPISPILLAFFYRCHRFFLLLYEVWLSGCFMLHFFHLCSRYGLFYEKWKPYSRGGDGSVDSACQISGQSL